jgi:hypothetical protein
MERKTLREWFAYLDSAERELTITEFMALMVFNQREYARVTLDLVRSIKDGTEHTEAMLGALDLLASNLAAMNGLPYAASGDIRAALDASRDDHRALSAAERVAAAERSGA